MNQTKIDLFVERICKLGCHKVNRSIIRMEQGMRVGGEKELTSAERRAALLELKSIMVVYGDRR